MDKSEFSLDKLELVAPAVRKEFDRIASEQGTKAAYDYLVDMAYKNTAVMIFVMDMLLPDACDAGDAE